MNTFQTLYMIFAPMFAVVFGLWVGSTFTMAEIAARELEQKPLPEPSKTWRAINLSIGGGYVLTESCQELSELRRAGYHIEKSGNERGGFVYLKILPPGHKD